MSGSGARFTFRANRNLGRHGWLRLTPAYSVGLVEELAADLGPDDRVLDPFCGTGTTALVCAERGIFCETLDINPFLVWLARAKCASYAREELDGARCLIAAAIAAQPSHDDWRPPLSNIERWWDGTTLTQLSATWRAIRDGDASDAARTLAKVAFCRAMMVVSGVSFRHQSMSFTNDISQGHKTPYDFPTSIVDALALIERSAGGGRLAPVRVRLGDSRGLGDIPEMGRFSSVITSPPYPNRMSYVRELRPYMYWLGFLSDGRSAGELDWEAIGGTWGIATSNLTHWRGERSDSGVVDDARLTSIEARSPVLANYVRKYVADMTAHIGSLPAVLASGARVSYVIGNSYFYGVPIETQEIFAELFRRAGFTAVTIRTLRKRTSKAGLFEYAVTAVWPSSEGTRRVL